MSKTIDSKVLEMRFENKQFEAGVQTSINTLDRLKTSLNLSSTTKGLSDVEAAAKKVDMTGLASGIDIVRNRFSALQIAGVTALANITNSAVNTGRKMLSALTTDPIKTGFEEYETKINAIQTIMSNTANKGTTMADVTRVLGELNTYADKTIYNFAEMTRNIGTFTAAGVGLEDSAKAIQGIANLAAASGSSSQQASTAMYQLSQALSTGTVRLMDWNSVVNAGMGGQKFQEALKATAKEHGIAVDEIIKKNGSFRDSLQDGWLSADILNETLSKFSVEGAKKYANSMMESGKWTQKQADALLKEAQAMEDAATKVKTFTQLWSTLKESAQSGWSQTWEIVVGDFEEAKELLTEISDVIGAVLGEQADSRNKLLQGWKDLGGRAAIVDSLRNTFEAIASVVKPIKEAFREIIPPMTAKHLYELSIGLKNFTANLKLSDENAERLKRTFKGVFSIFDFFRKIVVAVAKAIGSLFSSGGVGGVLDLILNLTASIGDVFTAINSGFKFDKIANVFSAIGDIIAGVVSGLTGFDGALSKVGEAVSNAVSGIVNGIKGAVSWLTSSFTLEDVLVGLAGGGVFAAAKKLKELFETLSDVGSKGLFGMLFGNREVFKPTTTISDILGGVKDSLQAFTSGIKIGSLVAIAAAIAILASALKKISTVKPADVVKSLFAIGIMFSILTKSFGSITKTMDVFKNKGLIKAGITMMAMAKAIDILASAMKKMAGLSFAEIGKGLLGIGGSMAVLAGGLKVMNGVKIKASTMVAMLIMAKVLKSLAGTLAELGALSWSEIGRGLTAMGGALVELVVAMKILNKVSGAKAIAGSIGILIAAKALDEIAGALTNLGALSWSEIGRGLTAMGGALAILGTVTGALGKLAGFSGLLGAITISVITSTLDDIAKALSEVGMLSWGEIARGLTGIGGVLTELALVSGILGKVAGLSGLAGAATIAISANALGDIAKAFEKFSGMSWNEIKIGLVGMGGALTEVSVITGLLGKLAGFSGLLGAGTLLIAVQALGDIANAFKKFGEMSWNAIKLGLVGMGGALVEVATVTGLLGKLAGFSGLLGAGTILIVVRGLGDVANALKKFGEMTWDEIKRGLVGMGGALTEIGLFSGILGKIAGFSGLIGAGTILVVAKGLEEIANSLKVFGEMSWEEIGRGLAGMGGALTEIAVVAGLLGSIAGVFGLVGAATIAIVAGPLGELADSVKKWATVKVPENLGKQLTSLAGGVLKFTLGGLGASAIAAVAVPLGDLATSVQKWKDVSVPEGMGKQLGSLADGVKKFSWAFAGGISIDIIAEPLGVLADSVKKWQGVTVSADLGTHLETLSKGVKSFSWAFMGSWSLSKIAEPLGQLADSVKKWRGVTVPSGLSDQLKSLADALKKFSGGRKFTNATEGMGEIAKAASKLSGVSYTKINNGLKSLANSLTDFASIKNSLSGIGDTITKNITKPINDLSGKLKKSGSKVMNSLASGMKSSSAVKSAVSSITSTVVKTIDSKSSSVRSSGTKMASALAKGVESKKSSVKTAFTNITKSALTAVKEYKDNFKTAGKDLGKGLINGINAKKQAAYDAGYALGKKAAQGVKDGSKEKSPSKLTYQYGIWQGEGLVNGIKAMGNKAYNAGYNLGDTSTKAVSNAVSRIADVLNSDMETQPTIRPVLDLSDVRAGAGAIDGMFGMTPSVGVMSNIGAISSMMSQRNQNGGNDDVISAINKLGKTLGNIGGTTYNVNGVTSNNGDVNSAIETLVRAVKIEGRA